MPEDREGPERDALLERTRGGASVDDGRPTRPTRDRAGEIASLVDARRRQSLKELISVDVIEEHRSQPKGPHSDRLARLLRYFRSEPIAGKLAVVCLGPGRYQLCRAAASRGTAPAVEEGTYASAQDAVHAVFLRRIEDLEAS